MCGRSISPWDRAADRCLGESPLSHSCLCHQTWQFSHTNQFSDTNSPLAVPPFSSVLTLIRVQVTSSHKSQVVGPQVTHNFSAAWLQIRGSHDPLLRFDHSLEHLTELRETRLYLLHDKGYGKDTDEQPGEETQGLRSACLEFGVNHPPSTWMCSSTRKLSESHALGIFMEPSSCRHDKLLSIIIHFQPLSLLWKWGSEPESSKHLTIVWSSW